MAMFVNPAVLTANTAALPLAELLAKARDAGDVVTDDSPFDAFTAVPVNAASSVACAQLEDALEPLRKSVPAPKLATSN